MKKSETSERPALADVAKDIRRKAAYLKRKPFNEQTEVYALTKEFFKAYLKKPQEFTSDELKQELHKVYLSTTVRSRVEILLEKLSLIEYTDTQYSQAEIKLLLEDLDGIVKDMVIEQRRHIPWLTRFVNWLWRKQPTERETVISEYPVLEPNDSSTIELNTVLEDIYAALEKGKVKKAVKYYKYLMKRYESLGATVQHQFYHEVNKAYEKILQHQN